jgi:hypothetical protein
VTTHERSLILVKRTGLTEDALRDRGLADFVHLSGQADASGVVFWKTQFQRRRAQANSA